MVYPCLSPTYQTDATHEQLIAIHWNIVVKQNKSLISVATVQRFSRHFRRSINRSEQI